MQNMDKKSCKDSFENNYICIPELTPMFGDSEMILDDLVRHFLILGETGSGKTYSAVQPLLKGVLKGIKNTNGTRYKTSLLIIDPKQNELTRYAKSRISKSDCKKRVMQIDKNKKINFFEGMGKMSLLDRADRIFEFSDSFSASAQGSNNREFAEFSMAFFLDFLISDDAVRRKFKDGTCDFIDLWNLLKAEVPGINIHTKHSYIQNMKSLLEFISASVNGICTELKEVLEKYEIPVPSMILQQSSGGFRMSDQFFYQKQYLDLLFKDYCSPDYESFIFLDPFECNIKKEHRTISIKNMILQNKILVFSPDETVNKHVSNCVGMLIKSLYFKYSLETYEKRLETNTFVFYVCDEFQRFVTCDDETGEQSFLDRCRAYNIACILSTQSVSSLKYALKIKDMMHNGADEEAVNIIITNAGNKMYFKSTDIQTQKGLRLIYPHPPMSKINDTALRHLLDVRPLSSLSRGECYFINSNGDCGKAHIKVA